MLYNSPITYSQASVFYAGAVSILAPSLTSPILINNITLLVFANEDYTNQTTIGIISLNYAPSGILEIQVLDEDVQAFFEVDQIAVSI